MNSKMTKSSNSQFLKWLKLLILTVITLPSYAANYYWVGGSGAWTSPTTHWATTSGGTTYYSIVPSQLDVVIFDANSFSASGQEVTMNVEGFCSEFRCRNVRSGVKFTATKSLNAYNGFSIDSNLIYNQSGGNLNVLSGNYSIGNNTSFTMSGNVTITLGNFTVLTGANYRLNSGTLTITNGNVNIERQSTFYQNGTFNITLGNFNLGSRTTYTQYGDMTISRGSFTMGDSVTWAKIIQSIKIMVILE